MATGFDSDYYNEPAPETTEPEKEETPAATPKDFAIENKTNMWESIKSEPEPDPIMNDDDLDVPPSLRERLKNKKRK